MYSFKDFIIANPSQETDELLAYIRQKRKRNDDIGTTIETFDTEEFESMVDTDEALTTAQRIKMKNAMKKNKAKIALGKKLAAKKKASPEKLKARAEKQARNIVIQKILKGKSKDDLSFSARGELEKKVDKKKAAIKKIAKKLLPDIKKKEAEKMQDKKSGE